MAAHGAAVRLKPAFSRSPQNEQAADKKNGEVWLLRIAGRGAAANVAHAFAMAIGMCLMNGYSVVKDPQTRLPKRKTGRESIRPSTCFLT